MDVSAGHPDPALRAAATRRLIALDTQGELTSENVRLMAATLVVSERTVWRWLCAARAEERFEAKSHSFTLTPKMLELLAFHYGCAAGLHRDLLEAAEPGAAVPSLRTVQRAVSRQVGLGDLAAMRVGERERRKYDVYLRRPPEHRNSAWEADHVEAPVEVLVRGRLRKPWVTWFIDTSKHAIAGAAITPGYPSSESIMAALGVAIDTRPPFGPIGGLPGRVRVDRGKDFLSKVLKDALRAWAVPLIELPPYGSYLKGTVEGMNGIAEKLCFKKMPRYTHRPTALNGKPVDPDQPALPFDALVAEFLKWTLEWNTEHPMTELGGRTPQQAWLDDPTPVFEPPSEDLIHLTLKKEDRTYKITSSGVKWKNAYYVGTWMEGDKVGLKVRVRFKPHHDEEIEIVDAERGRYLGTAKKSDMWTQAQAADLRRVREAKARLARKRAQAAEKLRSERYAAVTEPGPAVVLGSLTRAQADAELRDADREDMQKLARPDFIPLGAPEAGWETPRPRGRTGDAGKSPGGAQ